MKATGEGRGRGREPDPIGAVLRRARTIAVVGAKDDPAAPACFVPRYLQQHGYRILPVNPRYTSVLGERCYRSLMEIGEPVDIVNVFRAPANILPHALEALQLRPQAFWMQSGITHPEAAGSLSAAGILVIQDRCIMVEHGERMFPGRTPQ